MVFLPGVWHFDRFSEPPGWSHPEARAHLERLAAELELRFLDIQSVFERHRSPTSLYSYPGESHLGSPHMNAAGYATTAEAVAALLRD